MEWPTKDEVTEILVTNIIGEGKTFSELDNSWFTKHLIIAIREAIWLFILVAQGVYSSFTVKGSTGEELDDKGYDYNVTRNEARKAQHTVTLIKTLPPESDYLIPDDFLVTTTPIANGSPIKFTVMPGQNKYISAGTTSVSDVLVECTEYGIIGNVTDGEINLIAQAGIDRISDSKLYAAGADAESDDAYRLRIWDKRRRPEKAGVPADWESWAMEVSGVSSATCFRAAQGPGTIDIMILGPDNSFPEEGFLKEVKDYLIEHYLPADMEVDDLAVVAPEKIGIDIVISSVTFNDGYETETAEPILTAAVNRYLGASAKTVKLIDIITAIATASDPQSTTGTPIVYDFTLTAPTANITLTSKQVATLNSLTIEV